MLEKYRLDNYEFFKGGNKQRNNKNRLTIKTTKLP